MFVKSLADCPEIIAGDYTRLRELLHPARDAAKINYSLAHAKVAIGMWSALHALETSEVYYILRGYGIMEVDQEQRAVFPGEVIYIPPQAKQRIFATGPDELEFLCIVDPAWRAEDETVF
jgi:mannose-6-phosphate isomerase-like protein (cupin superfamily)